MQSFISVQGKKTINGLKENKTKKEEWAQTLAVAKSNQIFGQEKKNCLERKKIGHLRPKNQAITLRCKAFVILKNSKARLDLARKLLKEQTLLDGKKKPKTKKV